MLIGERPATSFEYLFTITTLCITVNIFAYILQQVSSLLVNMSLETQEYFQTLEIINKYMSTKKISKET